MATAKHTAPARAPSRPLHLDEKSALPRLTLHQYPPAQKAAVIEIVMEHTGLDLHGEVAEELPAVLAFESADEREAAVNALRAAGAEVTVEPYIAPEALAAEVDRAAAFGATPQGEALTAADDALIEVVACLDVVIRSLDAEDAGCHEVTVLRIAAERLLAAQESLEALERAATAEGAQS